MQTHTLSSKGTKTYTKEFRLQVIRDLINKDLTYKEASERFGVSSTAICNWYTDYRNAMQIAKPLLKKRRILSDEEFLEVAKAHHVTPVGMKGDYILSAGMQIPVFYARRARLMKRTGKTAEELFAASPPSSSTGSVTSNIITIENSLTEAAPVAPKPNNKLIEELAKQLAPALAPTVRELVYEMFGLTA